MLDAVVKRFRRTNRHLFGLIWYVLFARSGTFKANNLYQEALLVSLKQVVGAGAQPSH
jgi:hypothetical protein